MKTPGSILCAAVVCCSLSCSPPPAEDQDEAIILFPEETSRPVEDMQEAIVAPDMPDLIARDHGPDDRAVGNDMAPDLRADMAQQDQAPDLNTSDVVFEDLGVRSVRELFAWAQPGQSSPDAPLHIYYSATLDVYVGLDETTRWGEPEVRATFQALADLRERVPRAYMPLFERSRDGSTAHLQQPQSAGWTNLNHVAAFVLLSNTFQGGSGAVMASNVYALGPNMQGTYQNIPFLNIRPEVIEGSFATAGPQLVYPDASRAEARARYMQEGLADSLLHERMHAYISQFYAHDVRFAALRSQAFGCEYDLEELMVKRTLDVIYAPHPGLFSEAHRAYWSRDRELLGARLEPTSCYRHYEAQGWLDDPLFILEAP